MRIWESNELKGTDNSFDKTEDYSSSLALSFPNKILKEEINIISKPVDFFIERVKNIYWDFAQRKNPEVWALLLKEFSFIQIKFEDTMINMLLEFLYDHHNLPDSVWYLLINHFSIEEKKNDLENKFSSGFMNFILKSSKEESILRYELFDTSEKKDFDSYINLFFKIRENINNSNIEEAKVLLLEINKLGIEHPDFLILKINLLLQEMKIKDAEDIFDYLTLKYPNCYITLNAGGQIFLFSGDYNKAKKYFRKSLDINSLFIPSKIGLAEAYFNLDEYFLSREIYIDLMKELAYDNFIKECFIKTNKKIVDYYRNLALIENNNMKYKLFLAEALNNCEEYIESKKILESIVIEDSEKGLFYKIYLNVLFKLGEYKNVITHMEKFEESEIFNSGTYINHLMSLFYLGDFENVITFSEKYINIFKSEASFYSIKSLALSEKKEFEKALVEIQKGISRNPELPELYAEKAKIFYLMSNFEGALQVSDLAISIYPFYIEMYLLKIKIFIEKNQFDNALKIIHSSENSGVSSPMFNFYKAKIFIAKNINLSYAQELLNEASIAFPNNDEILYEKYLLEKNSLNFDDRIEIIEKLISINDSILRYYLLRLETFIEFKEFNLIQVESDTVKEKFGENSTEYYLFKGFVEKDQGEFEKAKTSFLKVIDENPKENNVYLHLGDIFFELADYKQSIEFYTKEIELNNSLYCYVSRGIVYGILEEKEMEKKDYFKAIEIEPNYSFAYNNLGLVYFFDKKYGEAIFYFSKAIEIDKNLFNSYVYLAKSYIYLQEYEKAFDMFNILINSIDEDLDIEIWKIYIEKANLLCFIGRYQNALEITQKIYDDGVKNYSAYRMLGKCNYLLGNFKESIKKYKLALNFNKYDFDTCIALGLVYLKGLCYFGKAVEYFLLAKNIDGNNYDAYYFLAIAYEKIGMVDKAKNNYSEANKLILEEMKKKPIQSCLYTKSGDCYLGLGNFNKASENFEKAIELSTEHCLCYQRQCHRSEYGMGRLFEKKGLFDKALERYDRAIFIKEEKEYIEAHKRVNRIIQLKKNYMYILISAVILFIVFFWVVSNIDLFFELIG